MSLVREVEKRIVEYLCGALELEEGVAVFRLGDWPRGLTHDEEDHVQILVKLAGGDMAIPNVFGQFPVMGRNLNGNIVLRGKDDDSVCDMAEAVQGFMHGAGPEQIPGVTKAWVEPWDRVRVLLPAQDGRRAGEDMIAVEATMSLHVAFDTTVTVNVEQENAED